MTLQSRLLIGMLLILFSPHPGFSRDIVINAVDDIMPAGSVIVSDGEGSW